MVLNKIIVNNIRVVCITDRLRMYGFVWVDDKKYILEAWSHFLREFVLSSVLLSVCNPNYTRNWGKVNNCFGLVGGDSVMSSFAIIFKASVRLTDHWLNVNQLAKMTSFSFIIGRHHLGFLSSWNIGGGDVVHTRAWRIYCHRYRHMFRFFLIL